MMTRILTICVLLAFGCNIGDDPPVVNPPGNNTPDMASDSATTEDLLEADMVPGACDECTSDHVCFEDLCCSPIMPETCSAEQCGMLDDGCGGMVDCPCVPAATALYVTRNSTGSGNVLQFDVASDGRLTPMGNPTVGTGTGNAVEIVISPDNRHVYIGAGNNGARPVHAFDIESEYNELRLNPYPQLEGPSGLQRRDSIAMDPAGRFLYMADQGPDRRSTFTYGIGQENQPGRLTFVAENRDHNTPRKVVVEPLGRFVYLLDGGRSVVILRVNEDAGIIPVGTLIDVERYDLPFSPFEMAVDPLGEYLYIVGNTSELGVYRINSTTGELAHVTAPNNATFFETADSPRKVAVDSLGRFLWIVSQDTIFTHAIRRDLGGVIEELDQDDNPNDFTGFPIASLRNLASDPSGRFLFAVGIGSTHTLTILPDGRLSEDVPSASGGGDNIAVLSLP